MYIFDLTPTKATRQISRKKLGDIEKMMAIGLLQTHTWLMNKNIRARLSTWSLFLLGMAVF